MRTELEAIYRQVAAGTLSKAAALALVRALAARGESPVSSPEPVAAKATPPAPARRALRPLGAPTRAETERVPAAAPVPLRKLTPLAPVADAGRPGVIVGDVRGHEAGIVELDLRRGVATDSGTSAAHDWPRQLREAAQRDDVRVVVVHGEVDVLGVVAAAECDVPVIAAVRGGSDESHRMLGRRYDLVVNGDATAAADAAARALARDVAASPRECLVLLKQHLARHALELEAVADDGDLRAFVTRLASVAMEGGGVMTPVAVPLRSPVVQAVAYPDGVFVATLRDEAGKNAFSSALTQGIQEVFEHLRASPRYKVAVFTGYGQVFASGGTKEGLLSIQQGAVRYSDAPLYEHALACEIPIVAAMQGHALGAGWSFGMFCDYPVLSDESLYSTRFMRYGFTPGFGSTLIFPVRGRASLARELLFAARDYTGRDLRERGIGLPVVPRAEVLARALALAHGFAKEPRDALVAEKLRRNARARALLPAIVRDELAMHDRTFVGNARARHQIERDFADARPTAPALAVAMPPPPAAPQRAILELLRATLAEELQLQPAEIDEDRPFTDLGLDSISGVTWVRRVNKRFGASISANQVYHAPTLREFAQLLQREATQLPEVAATVVPASAPAAPATESHRERAPLDIPVSAPPRPAVREAVRHPLSEGQKGLWMLHRLDPTMAAYNVPVAVRVVDPRWAEALDRAIAALLRRHPVLETVIATDEHGQPFQTIPPQPLIRVEREGVAAASAEAALARMRETFKVPFKLSHDPLMRVHLLASAAREEFLLITLHHILFDGTSLVTFIRDFLQLWGEAVDGGDSTAAAASTADPPRPAFFDFVAWEREFLQSAEADKELAYWKRQLAGDLPILDFPADRTRPPQQTFSGATVSVQLPADLSDRIRGLAKERKVSLFTLLLAVYQTLLHRYTRQEIIVVGVPVARRPEERFADAIGCFVNMVAAKATLGGEAVFTDLLEQVKWTVLDALEHARYPFSKLVSELGLEPNPAHSPVFQTVFVLQNFLRADSLGEAAAAGSAPIELLAELHQEGEYDLRLEVVEQGRELTLCAAYNPELYEPATMTRLLEHYAQLAAAIVAAPGRRLADYSCVGPAEQRRLEQRWNATARAYPRGGGVHDVFAARAAEMPDAVAVVAGETRLTYKELARRSTALARYLQSLAVGPERRVALCLQRAPEMVVAVLGVLQAGGAYVPLDPAYPAERMRFLLEDCGATVVLTDARSAGAVRRAQAPAVRAVLLDRDWARIEQEGGMFSPRARAAGPENLAYVIYTSGSTGTPKGVMVEHGQILNTLHYLEEAYPVGGRDAYLLKTNYTFDVSLSELFGWFMGRGHVVVLPPGDERFPERIAETIRASRITHVNFVPSALAAFLYTLKRDERFRREGGLKVVMVAGEALPKAQAIEAAQFFAPAKLENIYGPTETAIYASGYSCRPEGFPGAHTPIGGPLPNTRLYVLDAQRKSTGLGVPGELAIAGEGVARGYLNRAELTEERFVADPFVPGSRMFLTGDLARWLPDGVIEYLGRIDQQIKVRGFRVEPGEIETCLKQFPGVRDCVVLAVEKSGSKQLVAYFVPEAGAAPDVAQVTRHLAAKLPDYMVPGLIAPIDAIPLTASGKVDRRALSLRALARERTSEQKLPQSQVETVLVEIWQKLLGVDAVGTTDRFFEAGGDSLLAVALADQISRKFGCTFSAAAVFKHATIQALAEELSAAKADPPAAVALAPAPEVRPADSTVVALPAVASPGAAPAYYRDSLAIIGLSCRFPGAEDAGEFWRMLREGREGGRFLPKEELNARGVPAAMADDPRYVPLEMSIVGKDEFDPEFFHLSGRHALFMDPQFRALLMHAWNAVEDAGYAPTDIPDTSVFMSAGNSFYRGALEQSGALEKSDGYASWVLAQGGTIPAMVSYCLGLTGPSLFVHSNCSSSLAGLYLAQQSVQSGATKTALVGGATLFHAAQAGYLHRPGLNFSSDGHCRTFDAAADGMVGSEGVAVVLVKRASDAWADGDAIYAIVRGIAMNNDGAEKAGFYSPGARGQAAVIDQALRATGVAAETIGYVEAHGTGTQLGDPVEVMALAEAYRAHTQGTQFCGLGSVKTNIGHADTAAGLAGCIKLALSLQHRTLPPSLNFERANPGIALGESPFFVVDRLRPWEPAVGAPRRAALSSFGIGGTNGHAILEEPLERPATSGTGGGVGGTPFVVVLSARNPERLQERISQLRSFVQQVASLELADLAATLWTGRSPMAARVAFVARSRAELAQQLEAALGPGGKKGSADCWWGQAGDSAGDDLLSGKEAEDMAIKWRDEGRLDKIAKLWVRGFSPSWARLYPGRTFRRLHLPSYPFARERFALPAPEETSSRVNGAELHPLLHENVSSWQHAEFRSVFTGREFFLADHVVQGRKVMPGVAYLEMARAAAARLLPTTEAARIQLREVLWLRPLVVERAPCTVRIGFTAAGATGMTAFEIFSDATSEERTVYCRGTMEVADPVAAVVHDLAALRRATREGLGAEDCYAAFAGAGFNYGAGFRTLRELRVGENGRVIARVAEEGGSAPGRDAFLLRPGVLDGAWQALAAAAFVDGQTSVGASAAKAPPMPFALERVVIAQPCPAEVWVVARPSDGTRPGDRVQRRDLDLCDAQGRVCVSLRGYATSQVEPRVEPARASTLVFRPTWRLAPADGGEVPAFAVRWLICCGVPVVSLADTTVRVLDAEVPAGDNGGWFAVRATQIFEWVQELLRQRLTGPVLVQVAIPADGAPACLAAVAGLLRTAHLENPKFFGQVIEFGAATPAAEIAGNLLTEGARTNDVHVRRVAGERRVLAWEEPSLAEAAPGAAWREDGVYLVTGGVGAIGGHVARHILRHAGRTRVVLTGRAPRSVEEIAALGLPAERVEYRAMDVACESDVIALSRHVRERYGRLDGVLHAAGIIRDNFILKKTSEEFRAVLAAKVQGTRLLERELRALKPDFFALFSSGVAVFGNPGQADYATANAFLDQLARVQTATAGATRFVSINWPLWQEGGMRPSATGAVARAGLASLETATGLALLESAVSASVGQWLVLSGAAEVVRRLVAVGESAPALAGREAGAPIAVMADALRDRTTEWVRGVVADVVKLAPERIGGDVPFEKFGLDSILQVTVIENFERVVGELAKTLLFEYATVDEVVAYLLREHGAVLARQWQPQPTARVAATLAAASPVVVARAGAATSDVAGQSFPADAIAIIGVSGRYPMASSLEALWANLKSGRNCISKATRPEWRGEEVYGGFLDDIDRFDHGLFDVALEKVTGMSPESRLFLETVWELFEDAGYSRAALRQFQQRAGAGVGVFAATMYHQYAWSLPSPAMAELGSNATEWHIPNRVSHFFDLTGPSLAVNSACSGSLLAIHLACESLQQGSCSMAVAGGVNLTLLPSKYPFLKAAGVLGAGDRSRSFGEGDGYIPGEGVGAVLLKPLARAQADGDPIHAVILASFANHTGGRQIYTAPDPTQEARLIGAAMQRARVEARSISYVESAVNGSRLGDPIEVLALKKAFAPLTQERAFCALGSVKSNLGHLEAASGISQLSKVLLQLRHGTLVPSVNSRPRNPAIKLEGTPFYVQEDCTPWAPPADPTTGRTWPRRSLINSFGAGGTGANLVIEEYLAPPPTTLPVRPAPGPALWCVSAKSEESLAAQLERVAGYVEERPEVALHDVAWTLQRRDALEVRAALIATSRTQALELLARMRERRKTDAVAGMFFSGDGVRSEDAATRATGDALRDLALRWVAGEAAVTSVDGVVGRLLLDFPKYAFDHRRSFSPGGDMAAGPGEGADDGEVVARVRRGEMSREEFERFIRA